MSSTLSQSPSALRALSVETLRERVQAGQVVKLSGVPFLVRFARQETGPTAGAYLKCQLGDRTGWVDGVLWGSSKLAASRLSQLISAAAWMVDGTASLSRYGGKEAPQVKLDSANPIREDDISAHPGLVRRSASSEKQLGEWLSATIAGIQDGHLRLLLQDALGENGGWRTAYLRTPAGQSIHHAYVGGLADHVREMAAMWLSSCFLFPKVERDLTLAGILIHDIGKLDTMESSAPARYTRTGKFLDHITAGAARLSQLLDRYPDFPPELRDQLLHIVVAHHGEKEWGSPAKPATREAIVVHHLDRLTSLLDHFDDFASHNATDGDGFTTSKSPWLEVRVAVHPNAPEREE